VKIAVAELQLMAVDYSENSGSGIAKLRTSGSTLQKNSNSGIGDQRLWTTKFLNVADQPEDEAQILKSGPAEADYGKNSGCPPLIVIHISIS
jgi:hypothetical protein